MNLISTIQRIQRAWSLETTYTPEIWTPANPARGQCAVTAVLLAGLYCNHRPELMAGIATEPGAAPVAHYWLMLAGWEVDVTRMQFADHTVLSGRKKTTFAEVVSNEWMEERVRNLWVAFLA